MEIQKTIQAINNSMNMVQKMPEYVISENLKNILYGVPKELSEIKKVLKEKCEEYATNAYKFENYVMIPADEELSQAVERVALKLDIFGSMSTLRLRNKLELSNNANLFFFSAGDAQKDLRKFNSQHVTDRAKSEFYNEMKKILESKKADANEVLNQDVWFMDTDGRKIYNLAPDITGVTALSDIEGVEKDLYNKLFNK